MNRGSLLRGRGSSIVMQIILILTHTSQVPNFHKLCKIVLLDFSLTVKAATLIFIFGRGSAVSSAKEGKSEASSIMRALSGARYTDVRLYTL